MHSGDSAKASSALQLLDTRVPDQDPVFVAELVAEFLDDFLALSCPPTARGAIENSAARQSKLRFDSESALTGRINSNPSLHS